jgi:hypothetical protein
MQIGGLITVPTWPGGHITLERATNTMIARRHYYAGDMQDQNATLYIPISAVEQLLEERSGEQMPKTDPLDQPITVRQLADVVKDIRGSGSMPTMRRVIDQLVTDASETDFIKVRFGSGRTDYVYRVAQQPARRVQVGDLVTVPPRPSVSSNPQVARVSEVNVHRPPLSSRTAVAISPDDAERIEAAIGKVR